MIPNAMGGVEPVAGYALLNGCSCDWWSWALPDGWWIQHGDYPEQRRFFTTLGINGVLSQETLDWAHEVTMRCDAGSK